MSVSKSREHAEAAFGQLQSQFFARGHAVEEMDYATRSREKKTSRLREARLAKEEQDRLTALANAAVKPLKRA